MSEQNQFMSKTIAPAASAMAVATEGREIAEVQAAMTIAKRFPRDERQAMDRILNACTRKTLAETALYSYNRGGQEVTGPSIRLAEVLAQCWGNIQSGVRELEQTDDASIVEVFAWDLETNTRDAKVFRVPHVRHTKTGTKKLTDPRDIYENVANVGARRKRACVLAVIPGDVTEAAVAQCDVTLAASADVGPEAVKRLLEAFAGIGISKAQIEARLTNRVDAIRPAQMVALRKIFASIRDGISSTDDWFTSNESATILKDIQHREKAPESPQETPEPERDSRGVAWDARVHSAGKRTNSDGTWRRRKGVDPVQAAKTEDTQFKQEPPDDSMLSPEPPTFLDAMGWIETAQDMEALNLAMDATRDLDLTDDERADLDHAYEAQEATITRMQPA